MQKAISTRVWTTLFSASKGQNWDCKSESERGKVSFPLEFLAMKFHSRLAHPQLGSDVLILTQWATHLSGPFSTTVMRGGVLLVITCSVFVQIKKCCIKLLFLLNSGQFQIEAYFYHHGKRARNPDT